MNYKRIFIPNSLVFITIVTNNRKPILIQNVDILEQAFNIAKSKFNFEIVAKVVNPDHVHMIIKTENIKDYPAIVGVIKLNFTKLSKLNYGINNNRESNLWQRRYWEHTIINEEDLYRHLDYIHFNPVKHALVKSPKDWEYSSFFDYVKVGLYEQNWCNFDDRYKISSMELE